MAKLTPTSLWQGEPFNMNPLTSLCSTLQQILREIEQEIYRKESDYRFNSLFLLIFCLLHKEENEDAFLDSLPFTIYNLLTQTTTKPTLRFECISSPRHCHSLRWIHQSLTQNLDIMDNPR
ncbi:hypothetical protein EUGRSUZ_L01992 [Eucalyptus grandis]|uniref:Uncharacterized protein n=1 Tax=Eucalyptus grandis TaxID=71139 RepID=A0A058ZRS4_EUCGR|nr:hypothetical protein EUGRSUZ_L01992 [Eucalyptus grandis]